MVLEFFTTWTNIFLKLCTLHHCFLKLFFCGDIFQEQPIHDYWIFEQPKFKSIAIPYNFWQDNVKCFELKQVMRQENKDFVSILNIISTCSQTKVDILYLNNHCYKSPPIDPMFPYLFYLNKDVQEHNRKMLNLVQSETITLKAHSKQ